MRKRLIQLMVQNELLLTIHRSARKWYVGPIRQIQAEELGIDVEEPGALERAEAEGKIAPEVTQLKKA